MAPASSVADRIPAPDAVQVRSLDRRTPDVDAAAGSVAAGSAVELVMRWVALTAGAVVAAKTSPSAAPLLWGLPLLAFSCLRTAVTYAGRGAARFGSVPVLVLELGVAAFVASRTGGWHSGWMVTLAGLAALCGYAFPARWTGQVGSAVVIALFAANVAGRDLMARYSLDLDGLLLVAALSVSYAAWLARFGDRDRAELARTHERLMVTNDLLVLLERTLTRGEDATDPQQAARAVARLVRELLQPDVVVIATGGAGRPWRVLLSEGVTVPAMVEQLPALDLLAAEAATAGSRPVRLDAGAAPLSPASRSAAGIPLLVRGRLVGAVLVESERGGRWSDGELELMARMAPWAALIVDNACRFNALWIVGSAEERARVARNLHDNLGQSMAALGLELDWLARSMGDVAQVERVRELRQGVTNMVAELRYNMRDLCCDVSETRTLGEALGQLVRGVESRSSTRISLAVSADERLPLAQEHQVLQMARVLLGAAVESRAESVDLAWTAGLHGGCLEVGYDSASAAPGAHYETEAPMLMAIAEVRDRCWAVGATVECEVAGQGGRVRCLVGA